MAKRGCKLPDIIEQEIIQSYLAYFSLAEICDKFNVSQATIRNIRKRHNIVNRSRGVQIANKRFGRLVAMKRYGHTGKSVTWIFRCDCGKTLIRSASKVIESERLGYISRCGCYCQHHIFISNQKRKLFQVKKGASQRGLIWALPDDYAILLMESQCYYCGALPETIYARHNLGYGEFVYNGIDRYNNSIGYVEDNCVPCCYWCNRAKHTKSALTYYKYRQRLGPTNYD